MLVDNLYLIWVFIFIFAIINLIKYVLMVIALLKEESIKFTTINFIDIAATISYIITYIVWLIN